MTCNRHAAVSPNPAARYEHVYNFSVLNCHIHSDNFLAGSKRKSGKLEQDLFIPIGTFGMRPSGKYCKYNCTDQEKEI